MDWRAIIKSSWIMGFVSSVLIALSMICIISIPVQFYLLPFDNLFVYLNLGLPIPFIIIILNRPAHLKDSMLKGLTIGLLALLFFLTYWFIKLSSYSGYFEWGLIWAIIIFVFIPMLLITSMLSMVASYLIRKQIDKMKITSR